ncbi:MAG: DUF2334 domain-containing protein [Clostridiaceae bacterium]|nr:DUF2334 domain-containing protein [Clostridiaceae bacterium]
MKKLAFRIDDVCPHMDEGKFLAALKMLNEYGIKPLLGIIPDNQDPFLKQRDADPDFWLKMKEHQNEGCLIGMHGYRHVYDRKAKSMMTGRGKSEFAGHGFQVQCDKLEKGLAIMQQHDLAPDIFFAPAHAFDKNTLMALRQTGFKYVSDGRSHQCYERFGLKFIPCRSYRVSVKCAGITTVALHPCLNGERELATLRKTLNRNSACLASFSDLLDSGNYPLAWQLADEKLYVLYSLYLAPVILGVKKVLRPLKGKIKRTG